MREFNTTAPTVRILGDSLPKPLIDSTLAVGDIDSFTSYGVGDITYKGYPAGMGVGENEPYWKIERIRKIGTVLITDYAQGVIDYTSAWSSRTTYNYSR